MRQPLDMLRQSVGVPLLDRSHDPRVQGAPAIMEHAAVRDVVGEGVLERVLVLGEEACFVQELGRPEGRESTPEVGLGEIGDGLQERAGHVLADHGRRLEEPLVLGHQPIDARREHRLDRRGRLGVLEGPSKPIGATLAR